MKNQNVFIDGGRFKSSFQVESFGLGYALLGIVALIAFLPFLLLFYLFRQCWMWFRQHFRRLKSEYPLKNGLEISH